MGKGLSGYTQDRPAERIRLGDVVGFVAWIPVMVVTSVFLCVALPLLWLVNLVRWRDIKEVFFSG